MHALHSDIALIVDHTPALADETASSEFGWRRESVDGSTCWRDHEGRLVRYASSLTEVRELPRGAILYVGANPYARSDYQRIVAAARCQGVNICRTIAKATAKVTIGRVMRKPLVGVA